jgi:putative aminopeptidase FrvX
MHYDSFSEKNMLNQNNQTMNLKDKLQEKFLQLTQYVHSYGFEDEMVGLLPDNIQKDEVGNYFLKIGESETMFTAHLDTVCGDNIQEVNHIAELIDGDAIVRTDHNTILGADDRTGVLIMMYMIEKMIPGLYYFFIGEELGRLGSEKIAKCTPEFFKAYKRCISFDRNGFGSVITHQGAERCCSPIFATALVNELTQHTGHQHFSDKFGSFTDSMSFSHNHLIPNCTNISVGYFDQHSVYETQNITYLEKLCQAVTKVKWEALPGDLQKSVA